MNTIFIEVNVEIEYLIPNTSRDDGNENDEDLPRDLRHNSDDPEELDHRESKGCHLREDVQIHRALVRRGLQQQNNFKNQLTKISIGVETIKKP